MVRLALIKSSIAPFKGDKQQSFKAHIPCSNPGVSGAKLILRPSIMRSLTFKNRTISERISDRLANKME